MEAYLEAAQQLRTAGLSAPIVFASSNTKEYYAPSTTHLPADFAADLGMVSMSYAPNFGAAKFKLWDTEAAARAIAPLLGKVCTTQAPAC